jgi:Ca2+/Na+ antiporter
VREESPFLLEPAVIFSIYFLYIFYLYLFYSIDSNSMARWQSRATWVSAKKLNRPTKHFRHNYVLESAVAKVLA